MLAHRHALGAQMVAVTLLSAVSLAGCEGASSDAEPADAQRPAAPARDTCALGCQHLLDCGLCILDAAGACLSVADCTGVCANTPTGPGVAGCVSGAGCDPTAISSCLGPASDGGGSACEGCYWDGSACTWCSTSDWGQGPYSGACSSCDAACCAGR